MGVVARSNFVWTAMIAVGVALGAFTWLAWPETETRLVRLPYGEALPKHPVVAAPAARPATEAPVRATTPVEAPDTPPPAAPVPEPVEDVRVIASAELVPAPAAYEGPPPVASETEEDGYVETPEELGAEPLPGVGEPAPDPVDEPDEDEDRDDPILGVIELPQPGAG